MFDCYSCAREYDNEEWEREREFLNSFSFLDVINSVSRPFFKYPNAASPEKQLANLRGFVFTDGPLLNRFQESLWQEP